MNYSKIHTEFIADRRANPVTAGYTERHHIIPVSMGGSDDKKNLIVLTAGDHYFIHLLLAKIHDGKQWAGVYAMANLKGSSKKRNIYASRKMIEIARERMAEMSSKNAIDQHKGKEYRAIMSSDAVNAKRSETLKGRRSPMKGMKQPRSALLKMKKGTINYWNSEAGKTDREDKRKAWKENNPMNDPAIRAVTSAASKEYHNRPEIKEKYAKLCRDNNPMHNETARLKAAKKAGKREALKRKYFELSGFVGNKRNVTMKQVNDYLSKVA